MDKLSVWTNLTVVSSENIFRLSPESEKPESWLSGIETEDILEHIFGDLGDRVEDLEDLDALDDDSLADTENAADKLADFVALLDSGFLLPD